MSKRANTIRLPNLSFLEVTSHNKLVYWDSNSSFLGLLSMISAPNLKSVKFNSRLSWPVQLALENPIIQYLHPGPSGVPLFSNATSLQVSLSAYAGRVLSTHEIKSLQSQIQSIIQAGLAHRARTGAENLVVRELTVLKCECKVDQREGGKVGKVEGMAFRFIAKCCIA